MESGCQTQQYTLTIDKAMASRACMSFLLSTLEDSDYFIWVNRGWAKKAPGEISNYKEFVKGTLYLPTKISTSLVSGRIETDLMQRIELSNNEDIMKNGFLWQNLTWDRLNTFAEETTSLSSKTALPFILWRNNIPLIRG